MNGGDLFEINKDPFALFHQWYLQEQTLTTSRIPSACCLLTVGIDGFPNARFISLKEVSANAFVVTGSLASRKGIEICYSQKVSLTFWWPCTERQIRLQGNALRISDRMADKFFADRSRDSQIISIVSRQGEELINPHVLTNALAKYEAKHKGQQLTRPTDWGGYCISPIRIEFLEFNQSRSHQRILFELHDERWEFTRLQP